jgi:hypothetical protein
VFLAVARVRHRLGFLFANGAMMFRRITILIRFDTNGNGFIFITFMKCVFIYPQPLFAKPANRFSARVRLAAFLKPAIHVFGKWLYRQPYKNLLFLAKH